MVSSIPCKPGSIAIIGDVHIGAREPGLLAYATEYERLSMIERLYSVLKSSKIEHVIFAGDFFHTINVRPACIKSLLPLIRKHNSAGMSTTVVAGNHDTRDVSLHDSALYYLDSFYCNRVLQPMARTYTRRSTVGESVIAFA